MKILLSLLLIGSVAAIFDEEGDNLSHDEVATGEITGTARGGETYVPTSFPTISPSYYPTLGFSKSRKSGKAAPKLQIDYCEQSFEKAWAANVKAEKVIAETRQELREQCAFDDTDTGKSPFAPNLACPFIYTPDTGFLDEKEEVIEFFENITGGNETGIAFWQFQMYCECARGLTDECAAKIPDITPINESGLEYCKFASMWNGDIALNLLDTLDEEVQECGCTFVGTEKEVVAECPGLDLGANYVDPLLRVMFIEGQKWLRIPITRHGILLKVGEKGS